MADYATHEQLQEFRAETKAEFQQVRAETRAEFQQVRAELQELRAQTDAEFKAVHGELRAVRTDMKSMEGRLIWEIGHAVNSISEVFRGHIRVLDDKYKDLPDRVARLERRDREGDDS